MPGDERAIGTLLRIDSDILGVGRGPAYEAEASAARAGSDGAEAGTGDEGGGARAEGEGSGGGAERGGVHLDSERPFALIKLSGLCLHEGSGIEEMPMLITIIDGCPWTLYDR